MIILSLLKQTAHNQLPQNLYILKPLLIIFSISHTITDYLMHPHHYFHPLLHQMNIMTGVLIASSAIIYLQHFTSYTPQPLQIKQLDGSVVSAFGFGLKWIQCPLTKTIIPLWPTYYMPSNPQCTFSPTALKYYLHLPNITTHHLTFISLHHFATTKLLDYHHFITVCLCSMSLLLSPSIATSANTLTQTRQLLHQRFCHYSDDVLDTMCRKQCFLGLPKHILPA